MIATTITAIARMIPSSCAIFASWRQVDEPDVREGNRERCVSYVTLRRLSKKCKGSKHVGVEKAPAEWTAASTAIKSDPCISADRARRFDSILIVVCFGGHALGLYSESMLLADANK